MNEPEKPVPIASVRLRQVKIAALMLMLDLRKVLRLLDMLGIVVVKKPVP